VYQNQFASNTPIQAVDLDGLEAAVIGLSVRTTVLFVTLATNVSVVGARNGISIYVTPEAGLVESDRHNLYHYIAVPEFFFLLTLHMTKNLLIE